MAPTLCESTAPWPAPAHLEARRAPAQPGVAGALAGRAPRTVPASPLLPAQKQLLFSRFHPTDREPPDQTRALPNETQALSTQTRAVSTQNTGALQSTTGTSQSNTGALQSTTGTSHSNTGTSRLTTGALQSITGTSINHWRFRPTGAGRELGGGQCHDASKLLPRPSPPGMPPTYY